MSRLLREARGGVGMMLAAAMPVLIGLAAFAIDIGSMQLDTRRLQGMADAAALAAASANSADAQAAAETSVRAAGFPRPVSVRVTGGSYRADASIAPDARFTAGGSAGGAARVVLESTSPAFFARIFGRGAVPISRTATAARQRYASFSIGSRLASLDEGLLNALLSGLTGSKVSLSLMDYNALASADVDLLAILPLLRTKAGLDALTYNDILKSNVTTPQVLDAVAGALRADGKADAAGVVNALAGAVGGRSFSLSALIDAGPFGQQSEGGAGIAKVDSLALVTAILQLAGQQRQVALDLGATVPGLVSTRVSLAIGEREANSPWIAITDNGAPIVRTAQMRLYIRTQVGSVKLPGIGSLATIDLPLFVEIAGAEGKLDAIDCAGGTMRGVTLNARTDVARAAIGTIDEAKLGDFRTNIAPREASLVNLAVLGVYGSAELSAGATEPWQSLSFSAEEIAAGNRKTVKATAPVGGLTTSLLKRLSLRVVLLPIPPLGLSLTLPLDPVKEAVAGALALVAPALDNLLMGLLGALGVGIGEADLRVTGVRCGTAVLVG
ncbi:MAG: pilus assembly protein TadG-related protein [Sphingomonas bacterium]